MPTVHALVADLQFYILDILSPQVSLAYYNINKGGKGRVSSSSGRKDKERIL